MIVTPRLQVQYDRGSQRPKTSHGRLQLQQPSLDSSIDMDEASIPPIPMDFRPSTHSLILGTKKRLLSMKTGVKHQDKNKRITRNRRTKSSISQSSEISDEGTTNSLLMNDSEWNWLDEKFDYDKDSDDEFAKKAKDHISEHSVEVYKKVCQKYNEVPSRTVMKSLTAKNRKLVIKNSHLGPKGSKALAVALAVNSSIEVVDLTGNDIGSEGTNYICQTLAENVFISELTLAENSLQSAGIKCLAENIRRNEYIKVLNISGNSFEEYDAVHIAELIRENYALKELDISHNALREKGGQIIANALAENGSLQILNLSWNHLRRKGAIAVAECLRVNVGLKRLNLAWNGFHKEGCRALKRSLPDNNTLIELDMSSNRINIECLEDLLKGLKRNEMISVIKLSHNHLGTDGLNYILQVVKSTPNWCVKEIDISTEVVDMDFVVKYEELRSTRPVYIKYGLVRPCYVKMDVEKDDSAAFINDDPMIVLMEYMRLQNLRLMDLFTSLDADNSNSLSREEFRCGLLSANIPLGSPSLDKLIKDLDQDNDGEVDFNELLEGLKAHKRKVSKIQQKQKHLKFEETEIGQISLKIKALLQFRMLFHKMSIAKNNIEKEAMENTLQEYQDKLSDLSSMKKDMLQAGIDRARQAAQQRKDVTSSVKKSLNVINALSKGFGGSGENLRKQSVDISMLKPRKVSMDVSNGKSRTNSMGGGNKITASLLQKRPSQSGTSGDKKGVGAFKNIGQSMLRATSAPPKKAI